MIQQANLFTAVASLPAAFDRLSTWDERTIRVASQSRATVTVFSSV